MHSTDWLQFALFIGLLALITKPLGIYLTQVLDVNGKTWLDPVIGPLERLTYSLMGLDRNKEQGWKQYTLAMLLFSLVGLVFTYLILRYQHLLPLNPQNLPGLSDHLAFNTAVSFTTNTNWQSYGGESTMSYFSQMVGLAIHNFTSAAVGISIAAALVRGIARASATTLGNFWVDLVRTTYYLLLPICFVFALFLVSQGMIQNFKSYDTAKLVEPQTVQVAKMDASNQPLVDAAGQPVMKDKVVSEQTIVQGPMASQVAIKMLGTNGGGFFNANAAHPFENPNPLSNLLQNYMLLLIPLSLVVTFGQMVKDRRQSRLLMAVMAGILVAFAGFTAFVEKHAGHYLHADAVLLMVGLVVALLLGLSGMVYHFVFLKAAREGWPVVSPLVRLIVRDELAQRKSPVALAMLRRRRLTPTTGCSTCVRR